MKKRNENNTYLDMLEYASSFIAIGLFFYSLATYSQSNMNVLGASDAAVNTLPLWVSLSLAGVFIMGIIVLFTVILSHATIKKMKR